MALSCSHPSAHEIIALPNKVRIQHRLTTYFAGTVRAMSSQLSKGCRNRRGG